MDINEVEAINCASWDEIAEQLHNFALPSVTLDRDQGPISKSWVFRGVRDSSYELEPAIERDEMFKFLTWSALEVFVSSEFKARAHMHLSAPLIPQDELTWLAMMAHYGVPTRLLDFTYSPFVALYFAIRNRHEGRNPSKARIWAIDAGAVNRRFETVVWNAKRSANEKALKSAGIREASEPLNFGDLDLFSTERDSVTDHTDGFRALTASALSARGTQRGEQQRQGCVCLALPPTFNQRLASQQGVFLVNCTEKLTLARSLQAMMMACEEPWLRIFDISTNKSETIEERLFQLNIHEQSLFPDMEGLSGFIKQKARLQWK